MLLPKLRIYFADFPWSHCSIDQRLFTSESGCGYRYGPCMREKEISGGAFVRIVKAPRTALWLRRFPYVFMRLSPSEMIFEAQATSKRKDNSPQARLPWTHRRHLLCSLNSPHTGFGMLAEFPFPHCHRHHHRSNGTTAFPRRFSSGVRTDLPMSKYCSHGNLLRFSLLCSQQNNRYYHQDLH